MTSSVVVTTGSADSWVVPCLKTPNVPLRSEMKTTALLSGVQAVAMSRASSFVSRRGGLQVRPSFVTSPRKTCICNVDFRNASRFPSDRRAQRCDARSRRLGDPFGSANRGPCLTVNGDLPKIVVPQSRLPL